MKRMTWLLTASALLLVACEGGERPGSPEEGVETGAADSAQTVAEAERADPETVVMSVEEMGTMCGHVAGALEIEAEPCRIVDEDGALSVRFEAAEMGVPVVEVSHGSSFEAAEGVLEPISFYRADENSWGPTGGVFIGEALPNYRLCIDAVSLSPDAGANSLFVQRAGDAGRLVFNLPVATDEEPEDKRFGTAVVRMGDKGVFAVLPREPGTRIRKLSFQRCKRDF